MITKIFKGRFFIICSLLFSAALTSCDLDETNYTQLDQELVYGSEEGYQGLVNACYENLYYLYGKLDGILRQLNSEAFDPSEEELDRIQAKVEELADKLEKIMDEE